MPTIALAIQKGGSGKTTTAINLAAALKQMGHRILLVDMDPQANLTQALGLEQEPEPNIYHLLMEQAKGQKANLESIIQQRSGLDVVPAGLELADAEMELVAVYGREKFLHELLKPVKKNYDFIFIDCPPAVGMLTVNALAASDYVLTPLQAEFLPMKGLRSFIRHFETVKRTLNKKLKILGIVLSRYVERMNTHKRMYEQLQEEFGDLVFNTTIRTNIALAAAQEKGIDIFSFDKTSNGALDYLALAQEFKQKIEA